MPWRVDDGDVDNNTNNYFLTSFTQQNECQKYDNLKSKFGYDYDIDETTMATMAFALLTPIIGGLALIYACIGPCCIRPIVPSKWKSLGMIFITMSIFQGLALLVLDSSICNDNPVLQWMDSLAVVDNGLFLGSSLSCDDGGENIGCT